LVSLARAIVKNSKIIILDEATGEDTLFIKFPCKKHQSLRRFASFEASFSGQEAKRFFFLPTIGTQTCYFFPRIELGSEGAETDVWGPSLVCLAS
jgi:hypothetical protein